MSWWNEISLSLKDGALERILPQDLKDLSIFLWEKTQTEDFNGTVDMQDVSVMDFNKIRSLMKNEERLSLQDKRRLGRITEKYQIIVKYLVQKKKGGVARPNRKRKTQS